MATNSEREMLRGLLKQGLSQDRAKSIVLKFRAQQETKIEKVPEGAVVTEKKEEGLRLPEGLRFLEQKLPTKKDEVVTKAPADIKAPSILDPLKSVAPGFAKQLGIGVEEFVSEPLTKVAETSRKAAELFTTEATGEEGLQEGAGKVLKNIIPSLGKQGAELISTVANPIDTVDGLINLASGIVDKVVFGLLGTVTGKDTRTESIQTKMIDAVIADIKEKYGTPTKLKKALIENPILLIEIGTSAIKKAGRTGDLSTSDVIKVEKLNEKAVDLTEQFLKPTKDKTTRLADRISGDILEKGIEGTRKDVLKEAQTQLNVFGKQIEEIRKADGISGTMKRDDLLNIIDEAAERESIFLDELSKKPTDTLTVKEIEIISGQESKAKALDAIADQIGGMDEIIELDKLDRVKKAFDQVLNGTDASLDAFQNELRVTLANKIRAEISDANPSLAEVNKEFSFYKGLETVLNETLRREKGKFEGGGIESRRSGALRAVGGLTGVTIGSFFGPTGAAIGGVGGFAAANKLDAVLSSPKFKIVSAQKKKKLADAIANGDKQSFEKILDSIIVTQAIGIPKGLQEQGEKEQPRTKVDFFNR